MTKNPLKIRELRVRAVKVPMAHPHKTASGTITESPLVLTDVLTEEGVVGHSYVFCYAALALKPVAQLVKGLEPLIAGQPVAPLEIEQLLARRFRLLGPQGLTGIAMAAIDMARGTRSPGPTGCPWRGSWAARSSPSPPTARRVTTVRKAPRASPPSGRRAGSRE
jgi:mandelate racemase